MILFLKEVGM